VLLLLLGEGLAIMPAVDVMREHLLALPDKDPSSTSTSTSGEGEGERDPEALTQEEAGSGSGMEHGGALELLAAAVAGCTSLGEFVGPFLGGWLMVRTGYRGWVGGWRRVVGGAVGFAS
jgi:hypothetical protein